VGNRKVVLTVSVVYRGCAMPVAWSVLAGNTTQAWRGGVAADVAPAPPGHARPLDRAGVGRERGR
jgi:hypothetical protein